MRRVIIAIALTTAAAGAAGCSSGTAVRPAASCGTVRTNPLNGLLPTSKVATGPEQRAYRCFTAAAATCAAASIQVVYSGVDFGSAVVYAIDPGGTLARCPVTAYGQGSSANFGGSTSPVQITHCRAASVTSMTARITCPGQQPFLIPA